MPFLSKFHFKRTILAKLVTVQSYKTWYVIWYFSSNQFEQNNTNNILILHFFIECLLDVQQNNGICDNIVWNKEIELWFQTDSTLCIISNRIDRSNRQIHRSALVQYLLVLGFCLSVLRISSGTSVFIKLLNSTRTKRHRYCTHLHKVSCYSHIFLRQTFSRYLIVLKLANC